MSAGGFEVTFLGHQGWLFSAGDAHVLVDPLLTPSIGHGGANGVVYPPRAFTFDALPPIDAVVYTHEHEDHFDVPSIALIDRRVPIVLSARSSTAARSLLAEMGFLVRLARPDDVLSVGALEIHFFTSELCGGNAVGDEWDVVPFLVKDKRGHGSFFSTVDVPSHAGIDAALREIVERPGIWTWTNNGVDRSFVRGGRTVETGPPFDTPLLTQIALESYLALRFRWGEPAAFLFCGGGFAAEGEQAWMNRQMFRADSERVAAAMSVALPGRTILAPTPGQTVRMVHGALAGVEAERPFLRALPRAEWPSRAHAGDVTLMETYPPFTERRALTAPERDELTGELAELAAFLHGGDLFRALYSLGDGELEGREPTLALVLLDGDEDAITFEYDVAACAFVPADVADPFADYVAGVECWARDLLAVLRGDVGPTAIVFGRGRVWTSIPERIALSFESLLWPYCHPLRRPARFARLYRKLLATERGAPLCVRAAAPADSTLQPRRAGSLSR